LIALRMPPFQTVTVSENATPDSKRWHLIAALLAQPLLARAMLLGSAVYGLISWWGLPLMVCPWKNLTGLPCPGCGMTRSTFALLQGRYRESLESNAFSWVVLLLLMIVAVGVSIPARYRMAWIRSIGRWEHRSRWGLWFVIILVIYTLTRWASFL
jgi:hypothetical protein